MMIDKCQVRKCYTRGLLFIGQVDGVLIILNVSVQAIINYDSTFLHEKKSKESSLPFLLLFFKNFILVRKAHYLKIKICLRLHLRDLKILLTSKKFI
jgi:hypothetical protein